MVSLGGNKWKSLCTEVRHDGIRRGQNIREGQKEKAKMSGTTGRGEAKMLSRARVLV